MNASNRKTQLNSVSAPKRKFVFRVIAVVLAWLLVLQSGSWLGERYGSGVVYAAVDPCSTQAIMQAGCFNTDLAQLEKDAVQDFLTLHGLPASDADTLYTYGRTDVRDEIRAGMFVRMEDIISRHHQGAPLTTHESNLYTWLLNQVWANEKLLYQDAVNDRDSWHADPCDWKPDPDLDSKYQLNYNPPSICSNIPNLLDLFNTSPTIPSKDYFLGAALKKVYSASLANGLGAIVANDMNTKVLISWAVPAAIGAVAGIATGIVLAVTGAAIATAVSSSAAIGASIAAGVGATATGAVVGAFAAAAPFAGPAIVVVLFVCAIKAGIDAANAQDTEDALKDLDTLNANIQTNPPDLYALSQTSDGDIKLSYTLAAATLPEAPSTTDLPTHAATDPVFAIATNGQPTAGSDTLNYVDWYGNKWSAKTWGGWFVQTGTSSTGDQLTSITPTIQYLDWNGNKYFAGRLHNSLFLLTKAQPVPSDTLCPADPATGLSDFAGTCSGSVEQSFQLQGSNGEHLTVSLSAPPAFTTPAATSFSASGSSQTFTITASGAPAPTMTLGQNPNSTAFTQSSSGPGTAQIVYAGNGAAADGPYTFSIQASNVNGTVSQNITITLGDKPAFTSSTNAIFNYGAAGSFLITTSGDPAPSIAPTTSGGGFSLSLPAGLSLHDNGNGTATISGTPTDSSLCSSGLTESYGVTATNTLGSATQDIFPDVTCATPATRVGTTNASFTAGLSNTLTYAGAGDVLPDGSQGEIAMVCNLPQTSDLNWLSCHDNGNGTATLSGTPPVSETGQTFTEASPWIQPHAVGSTSDILPSPLSLYIAPLPMYNISGSDPLTDVLFYQSETTDSGQAVGFANFAPTYLSNNSAATFTETGYLPGAVTFIGSGGKVSIGYNFNSPNASKAGGVYPMTIVGNDGVSTQEFPMSVYVFAAPQLVSATSAAFNIGQTNTFNVSTQGFPKTPIYNSTNSQVNQQGMTISLSGSLPTGVTFSSTDSLGFNAGVGVISGTPCDQCAGTYPLTLTANNAAGGAVQNFTLTVPAVQGINGFTALGNKTYGAAPFTVSGVSASSGLAVSLASTTPSVCTISSATVTMLAAGTCSISASQAGNASFSAASSVTQSFMVNKATLTVTADAKSITYGAAAPAFTATIAGFVNGDPASVVTGVAGFATNATTTNGNPNAGSWTITPSAGSLTATNYSFTFVNGTLTVNVELNPQPVLQGISPSQINAGSPDTAITLTGSNFMTSSSVNVGTSNPALTFQGSTAVQVTLPAALLATGGTLSVTISNPAPGGGASQALQLTVVNPAPVIASLSPAYLMTGTAGSVVLRGSGFEPASIVQVNGQSRTMSFVSSSLINFSLTADDTTKAGVLQVTVTNPAPGGGTANAGLAVIKTADTVQLKLPQGVQVLTSSGSSPMITDGFAGIRLDTGGSASSSLSRSQVLAADADSGPSMPEVFARWSESVNGVTVNEATVPAMLPLTNARAYAMVNASTNTGIAMANPNGDPVTVSFVFTDSSGADFGSGSLTLPADGQVAKFLSEAPFNAPAGTEGTISFSASEPIGIIALRGTTSGGVFLMTPLPVTDLSAASATYSEAVPHFTDGAGWSTSLLLVNPTESPLRGTVQFLDGVSGAPVTMTVNGATATQFAYEIPPKGGQRLTTSGTAANLATGSIQVAADFFGSAAPSAIAVYTLRSGGNVVSESGIAGTVPQSSVQLYVESSGDFAGGAADSAESAIAISNAGNTAATVNLQFTVLNEEPSSDQATITIPAGGAKAMFLHEIPGFANLPSPLQGVVRVSTSDSAANLAVGELRGHYNEIGQFLMSSVPLIPAVNPAPDTELVIPQIVDGGGYSTTFVFVNTSGTPQNLILRAVDATGQPIKLTPQ